MFRVKVKGRADHTKPGADLLGKELVVHRTGLYILTEDGSWWSDFGNGGYNYQISGQPQDGPYQDGLFIERIPDAA